MVIQDILGYLIKGEIMDKTQLIKLYAQKGEIVTELEIMQAQLQRVNQQIVRMKNALLQELEPKEPAKNRNLDNIK